MLTANELSLHTRRRLVTVVSVLGVLTVVHDSTTCARHGRCPICQGDVRQLR